MKTINHTKLSTYKPYISEVIFKTIILRHQGSENKQMWLGYIKCFLFVIVLM